MYKSCWHIQEVITKIFELFLTADPPSTWGSRKLSPRANERINRGVRRGRGGRRRKKEEGNCFYLFPLLPSSAFSAVKSSRASCGLVEAIAGLSPQRLEQLQDPGSDRSLRPIILHGLHDGANHQEEIWLLRKMFAKRAL